MNAPLALTNETDYLVWLDSLPVEQQCAVECAAEYFALVVARNSATLITRLHQREAVTDTLRQQLTEREAYIQELLAQIPDTHARER